MASSRLSKLALLLSLSAHAILLSIRFVPPEVFRFKPPESPLEVVLVNAKSKSQPIEPKALAQSDLEGGGRHDQGRTTSFLPKSAKPSDGDVLKGVHYDSRGASTQSLVMRSRSGTVRLVEARHKLEKLDRYAAVTFS